MHYYIIPGLKNKKNIAFNRCYLEIHPCEILRAVSRYYQISEERIIKGQTRGISEEVFPRQVCIYLMCTLTCLPLRRIGDLMGGFDHSTASYAKNKIHNLLSVDESVKAQVEMLKTALI